MIARDKTCLCRIHRAPGDGWARTILLAVLCAVPAAAQHPYVTPNAPLLGAAWYPEQWPEAEWEHDLTLMEQAHFTVTRIGEFAWSRMEPSEGHYDLDWVARAIRLAEKHHIAVVLGTPTDAPPAWLTSKYPDTLGTDADGHIREHGGRRQFSYSSPHYRNFCVAIASEMAKRFGHDPNVLGWQIGNEYTDESFDPTTRRQFENFLQAKYKTLTNLNQHWATAYWSQTYNDWTQLSLPLPNANENPGLLLEHKHFVTATWRSFQHDQLAAIRALADKRQFITTNIGGLAWSDNWDHYAMTEELDLASWDEYVGTGHLNVVRNAFMNDFVRGWKRENFWVMETQPATVNWSPLNNALSPGETRALAWQAIGHGADALLYWQWRPALNGQEQYHGSIVGPGGEPLPLCPEVQQLGEDFLKTAAALKDTHPVADVAMLVDYDSRWAIDFQPHSKSYDQLDVNVRFYEILQRAAQSAGLSIDVVEPSQNKPLTQYKYLIAPSLNVIDEALAAKLVAYVEQGGHLLLGPRSGMKDGFNALNPQRQPGPLASALGGKVAQFYALDEPVQIKLPPKPAATANKSTSICIMGDKVEDCGHLDELLNPTSGTATVWAEALTANGPETKVLLRYGPEAGWLADQAAMIERPIGAGTIAYLGTLPEAAILRRLLYAEIHENHAGSAANGVGANVEVCFRADEHGHRVTIVINHNNDMGKWITLAGHLKNLLGETKLSYRDDANHLSLTQFTLPAQGVAVLVPERER